MADPETKTETKNSILPFIIIAVVIFLVWFFFFKNGNQIQIKPAAVEGAK